MIFQNMLMSDRVLAPFTKFVYKYWRAASPLGHPRDPLLPSMVQMWRPRLHDYGMHGVLSCKGTSHFSSSCESTTLCPPACRALRGIAPACLFTSALVIPLWILLQPL